MYFGDLFLVVDVESDWELCVACLRMAVGGVKVFRFLGLIGQLLCDGSLRELSCVNCRGSEKFAGL